MIANIDRTWFTADQHFDHSNIIEYADRPFSHVDEMNNILIQRWNMNIGPNDTVYLLGDFTLGADAQNFFSRLNGKINVLANYTHHDRRWLENFNLAFYRSMSGQYVHLEPPLLTLRFDNVKKNGRLLPIALCHFPLAVWENKHYGAIHLHGHSHGKYIPAGTAIWEKGFIWDVGVDNNDFCPVSLRQVLDRFEIRAE